MQYNIHVDVPVNQTLTEQINLMPVVRDLGQGFTLTGWLINSSSNLHLILYISTLFGKHAFAGPGCIPCRPHARDIKIASGCYTNFTNI